MPGVVEHYRLFFAGLLASQRFVDHEFYFVSRFWSRNYPFSPREDRARLKDLVLTERDGSHVPFVYQIRDDWGHSVIPQPSGVDRRVLVFPAQCEHLQ